MKKILIFANDDLVIYKCRKELVEKLLENHQVYLCIKKFKWYNELQNMGCKILFTNVDRNGTSILNDIKLFFEYRKIRKKINPDIILTYNIKPNIYANLFSTNKKCISIVNITGLGKAVEGKGKLQILTSFLYKLAMKNVACIFFQNENNMNFFKNNNIGYYKKYKLIPGSGVNLKQYQILPYPENQDIHFLFIARIMKEKGIDEYLEAAKTIKTNYPNTIFHILGFCEEDYREKLLQYEQLNYIIYEGMQENTIEFQKINHCTIHPSYYPEGMSNVCLESAACGRPVITTNRSGCRETVDDQKTGYIIKQQNLGDLIEKIEKFLSLSHKEKEQMGINGRKKMEKQFDRQIIVNEYIKEINNILKN